MFKVENVMPCQLTKNYQKNNIGKQTTLKTFKQNWI